MGARGGAEVRLRRGLLVVVAVAAGTAVLAGLARMGVEVPAGASHTPSHGPLFVVGVFGAVIALERAVALGGWWPLLAPALAVAGAVAMLAGEARLAPPLSIASAALLVAINAAIVRRQAAAFTWLMLLGSLTLVAGTVEWARGAPVFAVVPAWLAFFVLTIVAERLELSRLAPTPRWATTALVVAAVALGAAAIAATRGDPTIQRALGGLVALVAAWTARFDLARRTVRRPGLPRFAAASILAGVAWLLAAGVALARWGLPPAGPIYDAILHAVLVGFVLSMVFAHAPIILPAVARVDVPFDRALYVPLAVLHLGLVLRVAGDLALEPAWRKAGALGNALALALFLIAVMWARRRR